MAIAANNFDMYDKEEVEESEGIELAKEIGAIFQKTSPKEAVGVEDLFEKIGKKFLNLKKTESNSSFNHENSPKEQKLKEERSKKKDICYIF